MRSVRQPRGGKAPGAVPLAVAVPSSVAPSNTLTVLFATAVPVRVSILARLIPLTTWLSGDTEAMTGAAGAVEAITGSTACDAALVLLATSITVAVKA